MKEETADEQELRERTIDLINRQSTMALATAEENAAWVAPVYYVFYKSGFFFFSNPDSRHIREALSSKQASASIYPFVDTWQEIRGIQMSGGIRAVKPGLTAIQAVRAYIEKFPFTKDFFGSEETLNLEKFIKRFRVRLYRFEPHLVYYSDNRIRFGFRTEIKL